MQTKSLQTKRALRTVLLVLLLSVARMGIGYAQGQNVTIGDLKYWLSGSTARVNGHKDGENATGSLVIPSSVSYGGSVYSVTEIGWYAFSGCSGFIGSLTIPNSVTTIGSGAFSDCTGLTLVIFGNSVTDIGAGAFKNCSGLTSITIPSSVTSIGDNNSATINPFYGCTNLTSIIVEAGNTCFTSVDGVLFNLSKDEIIMCPPGKSGTYVIPNSVTSIGNQAFEGCAGLTSVSIPNSVTSIGGGAFSECTGLTSVTIPVSVTTIAGLAFYGCTNLTDILVASGNTSFASIDGVLCNSSKDTIVLYPPGRVGGYVIPNSITTIGAAAFYGHTGLTSISITNSVTTIESLAFIGCTGLVSIVIPDSVNTLEAGGKLCFAGCTSMVSVIIGNSVTSIGGSMFSGCTSLTSVVIGNSVTTIESLAFRDCTSLVSINIPNNVTSIKSEAFKACTSLASIAIPDSVALIEENTFENCTCLTLVTIPNSVVSIKNEAFKGCTSLASITIPNSVTSIGNEAFVGCTGLREVNFNAQNCSLNVDSVWKDCHDIMLNIGDGVTGLLGCAAWISISIDDTVESISPNVCNGCDNVTTIIIGKSVKTIGSMAFANNPRLNMIYYNVEKDLEASTDVFENCPNLTTIHIGPEVKEIGSNIFKGCNTVHFVVALGPTPAVLDAGAFSDIVDNSVLMVSCGKRVTYYSVWNMFPFNNIIEDCDTYGINVGAVGSGGTITPSVTEAQMGQEVQITITPNPGMALVSIKVVNANDPTQIVPISPTGKAASTYSFTMPPFEVVVMATFKNSGASVDENNSVEVAVYPNPTNGLLKIEAENIKHISISNILGQVVFDGKVGGDAFEYDFSVQKAGIYLVRIETASGVAVKKVSITR